MSRTRSHKCATSKLDGSGIEESWSLGDESLFERLKVTDVG